MSSVISASHRDGSKWLRPSNGTFLRSTDDRFPCPLLQPWIPSSQEVCSRLCDDWQCAILDAIKIFPSLKRTEHPPSLPFPDLPALQLLGLQLSPRSASFRFLMHVQLGFSTSAVASELLLSSHHVA